MQAVNHRQLFLASRIALIVTAITFAYRAALEGTWETEFNLTKEQIGWIFKPDTCLINYYPAGTGRLGLHRDDTEEDQKSPIISLSIGQSCSFLVGGHLRHDETQSMVIHSGDCLIFHREGRLLYHGVDKLFAGSDTDSILPAGGRISLTFRRHKIPAREKKYNSRFLQGI